MSVHPNRVGGYDVRYRDAAGKQRSRSFALKTDADTFDRETKRARQLGTLHILVAKPVTLDEYVATVWAPMYGPALAPRTREVYAWAYDRHIAPRLGGATIAAINAPAVARWQTAMVRAGVGHDTIVKARAVLSAVLQTAVEAGTVQVNPVRAVRGPKRRDPRPEVRPLAPAAVEALRAVLGDRDAVLVSVLAYAGLRPGEARTLRWSGVLERTLVVDAAKTGKRRTVRLLAPLASDLRAWRMATGRPAPDTPVIPGAAGGELSAKSFNHWRAATFLPALERAGLERARPYDLRHSFASLLLHEGRSVIYVARQLGHAANETLRTYGHVIDDLDDQPHLSAEDAIAAARKRRAA